MTMQIYAHRDFRQHVLTEAVDEVLTTQCAMTCDTAICGLHGMRMSKCPMQVSDYKVKVMIAEPKGKRGRRDPLFSEAFAHAIQQPGLEYGTSHLGPYSAMSEPFVRLTGRCNALKRQAMM